MEIEGMNISQAIKYLSKHNISVCEEEKGYRVTNAQNVSLICAEGAVITHALNLKHPPKIVSIVPNF